MAALLSTLLSLGRFVGAPRYPLPMPMRHVLRSRSSTTSLAAAQAAVAGQQEAVAGLSFDLETTGLLIGKAEIVQLAIVCVNSKNGAEFSRLVYPEGEIDQGASDVHGWTKAKLRAHGALPFRDAWTECEAWIDATFNATRPLVWAAHNGRRFDRPILERCVLDALGTPSLALSGERAVHVDTLAMARAALPGRSGPGSYTLGRLHADADAGSIEAAHDALADARALATVWQWLVTNHAAVDGEGAADEAGGRRSFQQYLQVTGYREGSSATPTPSTRRSLSKRARGARNPVVGQVSSTPVEGLVVSDDLDVISFPGVGEKLAARLRSMGIVSVGDLKRFWFERGANKKTVGTQLHKMLPGMPKITIFSMVKKLELSVQGPQVQGPQEGEQTALT